jgi:hypothetical protein
MHYVQDLASGTAPGEGDVVFTSYSFVNMLNGQNGSLELGLGSGSADHVKLEFNKLVAHGGTSSARGEVQLAAGLDVGNCETGDFVSAFGQTASGMYLFSLTMLHASPYCSGGEVSGSFRACFQSTN